LIGDLSSALDEGDKSKVFARFDLLWARLAVHIRAEHVCLFPSILEANFTLRSDGPQYQEAQRAIVQLRLDHEFFMRELGAAVNTIRKQETPSKHEAISKQLQDVRRSIVKIQSRLDQHNQLEKNHVYKWVNVLLGPVDWNRRSGFFSRHRRTMRSSDGLMFGLDSVSSSGSSLRIADIVSAIVSR
jgi:hypothetical protein